MAVRLTYNTQLNVKPRLLYIFTYWEFFRGIVMALVPIFICAVCGIDPPLLDTILIFTGYSLVIGYFKVGKPEGYLDHRLQHLMKPEHYRPGKRVIYYPVRPPIEKVIKEEKMSYEELKKRQIEVQKQLVERGIVPVHTNLPRYYSLNGVQSELDALEGMKDREQKEIELDRLEHAYNVINHMKVSAEEKLERGEEL